MALTLSTVVDILADLVVWYGSKCGAVANAPVQKFDVRGGDDAVRTRGNGHTFRRWRYSEYSPTAAALTIIECSYLHDIKANAR
jgi:hypothetical protein